MREDITKKVSPKIIKLVTLIMIWTLSFTINILINDGFLTIVLSTIPIYLSYKVIQADSIPAAAGKDVASFLKLFFGVLFVVGVILALNGH